MMIRVALVLSALVPLLLVGPITELAARELQLPACLFRVVFFGDPHVQEQATPTADGLLRWYVATQRTSNAMLRHECICARGMLEDNLSESYARERLSKVVEASGLSNAMYTAIPFDVGVSMKLRADKSIQGTPVQSGCYPRGSPLVMELKRVRV